MPAYNAAETLERTIYDIPLSHVQEIIMVDDQSKDHTITVANRIVHAHPKLTFSKNAQKTDPSLVLFTVFKHPLNRGYGGNQKTCYDLALNHGADIVVMLHPDYQYDPKLVKHFVEFIREGYFSVMLGSRIRTRREVLAGGMPVYKYFANRFLSLIQNISTGYNLSEWHTGMRAYTREVLERVDYDLFSDDFIFDGQMLFAIAEHKFAIGEIPVPVRYFAEASSINFARSTKYGLLTLLESAKFVVRTLPRPVRYLIAGGSAFATNIVAYSALLTLFHTWYPLAAFTGYWAGALVSFTLQKYWVFQKTQAEKIGREVVLYLILLGCNSLVNSALLYAFVEGFAWDQMISNILSNVLIAVSSYFIYKHVLFRTSAQIKNA